MLHPHVELRFISARVGYGVFATQRIPRGTITWVRDALDQTIAKEQAARLAPELQRQIAHFGYIDRHGAFVLPWDHARFVNHACAPSCLSPGYEIELAVTDIEPGEQLTNDYASLNIDVDFDCACPTPLCRGRVRPADPDRLIPLWDAQLRAVFGQVLQVPQPLWALVEEAPAIAAASRDPAQMRSSGEHIVPARRAPRA